MIVYSFLFLYRCELCLISYTQFKHILYSRQHPYNAHNTSCTLSAIKIRNINKVTGIVPACQTNTSIQIHQPNLLLWLVYLLIYMPNWIKIHTRRAVHTPYKETCLFCCGKCVQSSLRVFAVRESVFMMLFSLSLWAQN